MGKTAKRIPGWTLQRIADVYPRKTMSVWLRIVDKWVQCWVQCWIIRCPFWLKQIECLSSKCMIFLAKKIIAPFLVQVRWKRPRSLYMSIWECCGGRWGGRFRVSRKDAKSQRIYWTGLTGCSGFFLFAFSISRRNWKYRIRFAKGKEHSAKGTKIN